MNENKMEIREDLLAYLDGELTPARRLEIELALDEDSALREELQELKAHAELLRQTPAVAAPDQLWARIEKSLSAPAPRHILTPTFTRVAALAAAACLVVVVGWKLIPAKPESHVNPLQEVHKGPDIRVRPPYILEGTEPAEALNGYYEMIQIDIITGNRSNALLNLEAMEKTYQAAASEVNGQWRDKINQLRILLTNPYDDN